mgnify:CR=1 FL=1
MGYDYTPDEAAIESGSNAAVVESEKMAPTLDESRQTPAAMIGKVFSSVRAILAEL